MHCCRDIAILRYYFIFSCPSISIYIIVQIDCLMIAFDIFNRSFLHLIHENTMAGNERSDGFVSDDFVMSPNSAICMNIWIVDSFSF